MERTDLAELAKLLMTLRLTRLGVDSGLSEQAAAASARETVREHITDPVKALSTPDGAIVVNVETYLSHVGPITKGIFDVDNPPQTAEFKEANTRAIKAIESHRSKMWKGEGTISERFTDYIYYRTRLEVRSELGVLPNDIGFDSAFVSDMVKVCVAALAPKYENYDERRNIEHKSAKSDCFVATACFGSPDHSTVVSLRRIRDQWLSHHALGMSFIRLYCKIGPRMAVWIATRPFARVLVRFFLRQVARALDLLSGLSDFRR